jgi:hypothetical protein
MLFLERSQVAELATKAILRAGQGVVIARRIRNAKKQREGRR